MGVKFSSMLVALICFAMVVNAQYELSNVSANKGTKSLFKYLTDLSASSKKDSSSSKILSGIYGVRFPGRTDVVGAEALSNKIGVWPAIVTLEYCWSTGTLQTSSAESAMQWKVMNPQFIEHWEKGGIVKVRTTFPNPCNDKFGGANDDNVNVESILTDGTPQRIRWLGLLNEISMGFQDLEIHGVSVIYGGLEEPNNKNYWWGKLTDDQKDALWLDMHNYLTKTKKNNNVIWLFSPTASAKPNLISDKIRPYIDIVGLNIYSGTLKPYKEYYNGMIELQKPFIIGYWAPKADVGIYDYSTVMSEIKQTWPRTIGFVFTQGKNNPLEGLNADKLFKDKIVINVDKLKYKGR